MVSKKILENQYLYLGIGFISVLVLSGIVFVSSQYLNTKEPTGMVSLSISTQENLYQTQVSEAQLFSNEPTTVLFSPVENQGKALNMTCSINCIKQN